MSGFNHEVIFCIVNTGFSETVMEAAKDAGARGGTILNARGTANKEAESFFPYRDPARKRNRDDSGGRQDQGCGFTCPLPEGGA